MLFCASIFLPASLCFLPLLLLSILSHPSCSFPSFPIVSTKLCPKCGEYVRISLSLSLSLSLCLSVSRSLARSLAPPPRLSLSTTLSTFPIAHPHPSLPLSLSCAWLFYQLIIREGEREGGRERGRDGEREGVERSWDGWAYPSTLSDKQACNLVRVPCSNFKSSMQFPPKRDAPSTETRCSFHRE